MRYLLALVCFLVSWPVLADDTAYDRVIKSGTLRCGYIPYAQYFQVDPNTGAKSGINHDVMEEIGRLMNIKIEWAEELTWATVATALQTGRVDAFCSGMWVDTQNGKFIGFTDPLYYNTIGAYVRADETRFTKLEDLNNEAVRVLSRDGGTPGIIARQSFPKASVVSNPSSISDGELIEQLSANKADVIFYGDDFMADIMKKTPNKFKALEPARKLRVYGAAYAFPITDAGMQNMLNAAILELKGSHFIDDVIAKYGLTDSLAKTMQ